MVEAEFGLEVVDRITQHPALTGHGAYTSVGNYPHEDLITMVGQLSEEVGLTGRDLVYAFGKYLFQTFAKNYPAFFQDQTDPLKFLSGIETVIHTEVRKIYPEAKLPKFEYRFDDPDTLHLFYQSERPFADLAEGLIDATLIRFDQGGRAERLEVPADADYQAHFVVYRR